jgi:Transglycosylase-like domain
MSFLRVAVLALVLVLAACGTTDDTAETHPGGSREPTVPTGPDPLTVRTETFEADALVRYVYVVTLDYAAKIEQARYDETQRARVAAAVDQTDDDPDTEPARVAQGDNGTCGGALPPCAVKQRESGGDYRADNPNSTACGAWQIIDSTWDNYGGYSSACDAPPEVQDAKAAELWADGAGCDHWSETDGC